MLSMAWSSHLDACASAFAGDSRLFASAWLLHPLSSQSLGNLLPSQSGDTAPVMIPVWVEACVPLVLISTFGAAMGGLQVRLARCYWPALPSAGPLPESRVFLASMPAGRGAPRLLRQAQAH